MDGPTERAERDRAGEGGDGRLPLAALERMLSDPAVPPHELRRYLVPDRRASTPFAPVLVPDPARVRVPAEGLALEGLALEGALGMDWANALTRTRRRADFRLRRVVPPDLPMLVSFGDSWFQFPVFLDDVVDQLGAHHDVWSADAAGITLREMVLDRPGLAVAELHRAGGRPRALLVSGGGNDIVGEDAAGRSVLGRILRPFEAGRPADWYLETPAFAAQMTLLERCYRTLLGEVATAFPGLPVLCHGYDRSIPGTPGGTPDPPWAEPDQWVGGPLRRDLGIVDRGLQRAIVGLMIDRLNAMQRTLCGGNVRGGAFAHAWHVDVRGVVGDARWADELHPDDAGFAAVAAAFGAVLSRIPARP